jgi:hypothetical protein
VQKFFLQVLNTKQRKTQDAPIWEHARMCTGALRICRKRADAAVLGLRAVPPIHCAGQIDSSFF